MRSKRWQRRSDWNSRRIALTNHGTAPGGLLNRIHRAKSIVSWLTLIAALLLPAMHGQTAGVEPAAAPIKDDDAKLKLEFKTESIRGKVVWLNEALKRRFQISTVDDAAKRTLAIETDQGEILPILEDLRGRSFRTDERLRGQTMELFVRRYAKHPLLQVIRIYEFEKDKKFEVDYWCDVCAIVMYEKGLCSCCQDENRLRKRVVEDSEGKDRESSPALDSIR